MRQIVLDTETTGMRVEDDNRIIEIGCVELLNRKLTGNNFHVYINPQRDSEEGALEVHGLTTEFLSDKPLFGEVARQFVEYVKDAELVIHNAAFDIGFLDHELAMLEGNHASMKDLCEVVDSLALAKQIHPGSKNNLDALCKRYGVDNSGRELHGALLDAELLAEVFLLMTGGQRDLSWDGQNNASAYGRQDEEINRIERSGEQLPVLEASPEEQQAHRAMLEHMGSQCEELAWKEG